MKWARINRAHFNLDHVSSFYWKLGKLYIWAPGDTEPEWYSDPDRKNYLRLCKVLGVSPIEEDADGEG